MTLIGAADRKFPGIAKWEWDIGNTGAFKETPDSSVEVEYPGSGAYFLFCVLRVTGTNGFVG